MKALDEILVLVPSTLGVDVCSVGDLVRELGNEDTLDAAVEAASIDATAGIGTSDAVLAELRGLLTRIRQNNASPGFTYWEAEEVAHR